ncbi:MAG TPA: aminotransferase class IV [Anaerolineales bacterium]
MPADVSSFDAVTRSLPGGFYTTFRTLGGRSKVVGLASHLDRLYGPSAALRLRPSVAPAELCGHLQALLESFPAEEARIRIILCTADKSGTIYAVLEPLQLPEPAVYERGVKVITTRAERQDPLLKYTGFIDESQNERKKLAKYSAFEGLIVKGGRIYEGLTSNFFYIAGGKLCTERRGVLDGVTRRQVVQVAPSCRFRITYRALRTSEVATIDEAFITSSSRGIVPVVMIDDKKVGSGRVGEGTICLMHAYEAAVEQIAEPIVR